MNDGFAALAAARGLVEKLDRLERLLGGLSAREFLTAAFVAGRDARVRAIDITEVDAKADAPDGRTVRLAAMAVLEACAGLALRPLTVLEHGLVAVFAWLAGLVWVGQTGSMQTNIVIIGTQIFDVILVVVLGGVSLVGGRGGVLSVVVGCALVDALKTRLDKNGKATRKSVKAVTDLVTALADGVRGAHRAAV